MFDALCLCILMVSAVVGFVRGASRELVALTSLAVAGAVAVLTVRYSARVAHTILDTDWLANAVGMLGVFLVVYVALRMIGGAMTKRIHETHLGSLDRAVGVGFGLIRGLVVLGVFNIVFHAATPVDRTPSWVTGAKLYPLTSVSADALRALAPRGAFVAGKVAPVLERAVTDSGDTSPEEIRDKSVNEDYDPAAIKNIDDLVEKSH